ncbi:uncharacterized protein LOC135154857 isoform X2 [Lytechinus pictus]|uniref:uncharacterized protein LOC135154857 isoform X2 n=1 Tax=Lytechinus pictus TaxID=7653 RepID=UPI0030B9B238
MSSTKDPSFAVTVLLAFATATVFGTTQKLSATIGNTVNITCLFGEGTLRNIYWYYNNTQKILTLANGDLKVEQSYIGRAGLQKDSATLYLKYITIAYEGTYRCDVERQGQPAVLDIISELKVYAFELHTERSVKVVRGRNASLICSFTDPADAVYWYKHNSTGAPDNDAELVASEFLGRSDPLPGIERFRITEDYRLLIRDHLFLCRCSSDGENDMGLHGPKNHSFGRFPWTNNWPLQHLYTGRMYIQCSHGS